VADTIRTPRSHQANGRTHAVFRQILAHLGLPTAAPSLRAPPDQPDGLPADPPREWSYELLFDDLPVPDPVIV
jgi:hypothetical protein